MSIRRFGLVLLTTLLLGTLACGPDASHDAAGPAHDEARDKVTASAPARLIEAEFGPAVQPYSLEVLHRFVGEGADESVPAGVYIGSDLVKDMEGGQSVARTVERRVVLSHSGRAMLASFGRDAEGLLSTGPRERAVWGRAGTVWFIRVKPLHGGEPQDLRLELTADGLDLHLPEQHITSSGLAEKIRVVTLRKR